MKADKDTGQTLMSGMGTLHLEVKQHRLERDFRVKVRVGKPRVSYREMLAAPRTVEAKVDRLGDKPAFAELKVSFTNFKSDKPVAVFNAVNTEANPVPPAFLAAAEKALTDALSTGELGYPMMNAQARMLDAKFDPQLSTRRRVRGRGDPGLPRGDRGQRAAARTDHEGDGDDAARVPGQHPRRPRARAARSSRRR